MDGWMDGWMDARMYGFVLYAFFSLLCLYMCDVYCCLFVVCFLCFLLKF